MNRKRKKNRTSGLAIFVGTILQQRILGALLPELSEKLHPSTPTIVSLDAFYQFGLDVTEFGAVKTLSGLLHTPWYERKPVLKAASLLHFAGQVAALSRRCSHFLFFVDTGLIERTAITLLNLLNRRTAVLQDAMKRQPRQVKRRSLTWFGGGNADLYMLIGQRYFPMVGWGRSEVKLVGSPIYSNRCIPSPPGRKILVFNQCFACYGETTEAVEYDFMRQVVERASRYGPVELRLHPHNDPVLYRSLASDAVEVTRERPLSRSIREAGIALAVNSSTILEALASGRPVLTLDWHPSPFRHLIKRGVTPCADMAQMAAHLERWKNGAFGFQEMEKDIRRELARQVARSGSEAIRGITDEIAAFARHR